MKHKFVGVILALILTAGCAGSTPIDADLIGSTKPCPNGQVPVPGNGKKCGKPTTTTTTTVPTTSTSTSTTSTSTTSTSTTSTSTTSTSTTSTTAPTTTTTTIPPSGALWWGNADNDVDRGDQTNCLDKNTESAPQERLGIMTDPTGAGHGDIYRAYLLSSDIGAGNKRAEWSKTFLNCDGNTELFLWNGTDRVRHIGWKSYFTGTMANGGNLLQWKGDSTCGGPAVGMTVRSGRLTLRTLDGDADKGGVEQLWVDPVLLSSRMNAWQSFVMSVNFSKGSGGWIEFKVNGVPQTMADGTTRFEGPTVCPNDAEVWAKWGVYGFDSGNPIHYLENPRIGTTIDQVTP